MMTRYILASLALVGVASGCQKPLDEVDEFRRGVPRQETVTVTVPGADKGTGQALTLENNAQGGRGQVADYYKLTYGVTHIINGGALFVGALVKGVLHFPPTTLSADTAVWGPFLGELEPISWKVTIHRVGEHQFQYAFEGQPKSDPAAPFVTVLSGTHTASVDGQGDAIEGFGNGSFTLDWDARNTLPLPDLNQVGKANYTYARQPGTEASIDAQFRQVKDKDTGKLVDIDYAYRHQPAGGGSMDFTSDATAQLGMPAGRYAVRSRWMPNGAGRSDAKASNTDIPAGVTVSECWDPLFLSTFLAPSWAPILGYGAEATDCVFPTAEFSKL